MTNNPAMNDDKASRRRPQARSPEPRPNRRTGPENAFAAAVMTEFAHQNAAPDNTISTSRKVAPRPAKTPLTSNPHRPVTHNRRA